MTTLIKVTFISGLRNIVLNEIKKVPDLNIIYQGTEELYFDSSSDIKSILLLRSILNVYIVKQGDKLNPYFLSKHKSILGELLETVKKDNVFKSFKLSCAGSDSEEVVEIKKFITNTYKMELKDEADMEIFIGKLGNTWEIGVRVTPRPLSLRNYKIENIEGGLNSTIAYAINTFCDLDSAKSYLNIFSGSGTLLIEAGLINNKLKLLGFDINGKTNSLAVENIKKAGLIKKIQLKTADILDKPQLGKFDIIVSDLPFGMKISKGEDLEILYKTFVEYSEESLEQSGLLALYTTEHELLTKIVEESRLIITESIELKVPTTVGNYIHPKILICKHIS